MRKPQQGIKPIKKLSDDTMFGLKCVGVAGLQQAGTKKRIEYL